MPEEEAGSRGLTALAATLAADAARIARALDARSGRRAKAPLRALLRAEEMLFELERSPSATGTEDYSRTLEAAALAAVALAEARAALDDLATVAPE